MEFDYIVVGAGSAGCVVASRLSENPDVSVALLEAGKAGRSILIHAPVGIVATVPRKIYNWAFETVPQPGLNGRRGYQPRGKVLGGSSSINAMMYMRGHPGDYDDWAALGNTGWSWNDVLPYFKKAEHNERGADAFHGTGGPLNVADLRSGLENVTRAFIAAGMEAGHKRNDDFNGVDQEGVGFTQVTQKNGRRCSSARAYLSLAEGRRNLTVFTESNALRLVMDGKACTGVEAQVRGARTTLTARREVIVASGAFGSPQLLLLSGIGPEAELSRHGIEVTHELPGVGCNLQDHIDYALAYDSGSREVFGFSARGILDLLAAIGQFRREGRGMIASNLAEGAAFLKTDPSLARPDIQLNFVVAIIEDHGRRLHMAHGFSCHACVLRPKSIGSVGLASANPLAPPRIDPAFLSDPADAQTLLEGTRIAADIMERPALAPFRRSELFGARGMSDEQLMHSIRNRADTIYHPVGTCKMGVDEMAVVDPQLRVRGIEGLRVADASIMPKLIGGNTNAAAIMIGEKAADLVKAASG